jgi:hypothetical protein
MLIYDSTTLAFTQKAETFLKEILIGLGFEVRKTRFVYKNYIFPVNVVVFEGPEWGHFNAPYMQIGLNRKLIYMAKDSVVRDILKHELAHYLTHLFYRGQNIKPHGPEFKAVCAQFGFPEDVARATMNLDASNLSKEGDLASERILEKVKKLLMLATSSNVHEAELATLKANELLLRHNLDYLKDKQEPIYLERILMRPRKDTKLSAIYEILQHFIVKPVISMGTGTCCLEVSGSLTNVKLAGYVGNFLDQEMDRLWEMAKKEHGLSGLRGKNSFFIGVAKGFNEKMKNSKKSYSDTDKQALMVVEQKLTLDTRLIYSRLTNVRSGHQPDHNASSVGHAKGLSLTIRNAVEGKGKNLYLTE